MTNYINLNFKLNSRENFNKIFHIVSLNFTKLNIIGYLKYL
jgi:hypothetical protein